MKIIKIILVAISALFFFGSCIDKQNEIICEECGDEIFRGKVKSVIQSEFSVIDKFGKIMKEEKDSEVELLFNIQGKLTEGKDRFTGDRIVKEYNDNNDVVRVKNYEYNDMTIDSTMVIYKYDDKNNLIEQKEYESNNIIFNITYKYNENNQLIEECKYNTDDILNYQTMYEYDSKDNLLEKNIYLLNSDYNRMTKEVYIYDDKNNVIEENIHNIGRFSRKLTYKYDKEGNRIEYTEYEGWRHSFSFEYDDMPYYNQKIRKNEYKYDKQGSIIEKASYTFYSLNDKVIKTVDEPKRLYKYEYDNQNNWIKKISFYEGTAKSITERKIEYYE